jgi:hypothetical protein
MNIKLQRPGNTETSLILSNRLISNKIVSSFGLEENYINILYSMCGFYDKSIKGSYFDIDYKQVINSKHYQNWLKEYNDSLYRSDYLHPLIDKQGFSGYIPNIIDWIKTLNVGCSSEVNRIFDSNFDICSSKKMSIYQGYWWNYPVLFPFLKDQRVLVVNSFDGLIKQQFKSKNLSKIHEGFPDITDLLTVKTPFTFFNNGPHDNYQQTIEFIWSEILEIKDKFDTALVSCGPMGCIITDRIHKLNKNAIYMGSGLHNMFGISVSNPKNKYWISEIPKEYIPENYEKIEGGRYWN